MRWADVRCPGLRSRGPCRVNPCSSSSLSVTGRTKSASGCRVWHGLPYQAFGRGACEKAVPGQADLRCSTTERPGQVGRAEGKRVYVQRICRFAKVVYRHASEEETVVCPADCRVLVHTTVLYWSCGSAGPRTRLRLSGSLSPGRRCVRRRSSCAVHLPQRRWMRFPLCRDCEAALEASMVSETKALGRGDGACARLDGEVQWAHAKSVLKVAAASGCGRG